MSNYVEYELNGELIDVNIDSPEGQAWLKGEGINAKPTGNKDLRQEGKTSGDAAGVNATSVTATPNQETDLSNNNQQENTGLTSEPGSLESVDKTIDRFRAFKPKEERLLEIQSEAQQQIDLLNQTSQAELPPKNIKPYTAFASKHSTQVAISSAPSTEYQQARNKRDKAIGELNDLKQEAVRNILRNNYSTTGEKLEPGTDKYEEFIKNIPQESLNAEMLKVRSKNLEQQEFEDNFEETMEELSSVENPFSIMAAGIKKSSYQKDLEQETSESAKKLNDEIQSNVKKSKQFISNLESVELKFNDLKNLQEKLADVNKRANEISSKEYKTQEEVDEANRLLTDLKAEFDKLNLDYDNSGGLSYEELVDFRDKNLEGYRKTHQEGSGLVEKEEELAGYLDAVGRNYGWAANLGGQLASSVMTLTSTGLEFAQKTLEIPKELGIPEWIAPLVMGPVSGLMKATPLTRKGIDAIDKVNEDLLNGLEKPGEFKDINNAEEFGEWFGHLVTSQAANTAVVFSTGGASLFILGASSAGQKFKDIDKEERDTGKNYTFAQKYSTAYLTGFAEGASETVTLGQARRVKALLKKGTPGGRGFLNVMKRNFGTRKGLYQNLYDPIEEGGTEVLAQLASNATDKFILGHKDKSLLEGTSESFISGVFMSGLVYKSPLIGKNVVKAFQSTDTSAELQELSEAIHRESMLLSGEVELSPENRKASEMKLGLLVDQYSTVMDESISNIDKMTDAEKKTLIDVDVTIAALKANNKSIRGEFGLTQEQIDSQVNDNNEQIAHLTALKNQTIANANKSENLSNIERDTKELERKATKMFGKPISVVKVNKQNSAEQLELYKKGEIEAVDKKIQSKKEELKTADKESRAKIKEQIKQLQIDKLAVQDINEDTFKNSHGASAIHADMILVNPEFAAERGAINVVYHEMMHQLLKNTLADNPRAAIALGNAVDDILSGLDPDVVAQSEMSSRLTAYINKPESVRAEEKVTLLMDALKSGDIKVDRSLGAKLKSPIRRILQASGMKNVELNTAEDVLNFITDMNAKSNIFGRNKAFTKASLEGIKIGRELTAGINVDPEVGPKVSKESLDNFYDELSPDDLVQIIKSPSTDAKQLSSAETALTKQFELLALKALRYDTRKGDINRADVLSAASVYLPGIIKRFDPASAKFSTFVTSNIAPKKQVIYEEAKSLFFGDTQSIDTEQARQVADVQETTSKPARKVQPKTNILKFTGVDKVVDKITSLVKVSKGDNFKSIISKYAGKVGELVFDIPAKKIMEGGANLVPTTKFKDGMAVPSEAQNIQRFFNAPQNLDKFVRTLPLYNVADMDADINELGQNIDVSRDTYGVAIGLRGLPLDYFYEDFVDPRATSEDPEIKKRSITSPKGRSKGVSSQTQVKRLKPEFRNATPEVIEKLKEDLGITPERTQPNIYNRDIGQLLKGMAKVYSMNASLSAAQRFQEAKLEKAPESEVKSIQQQTADITAAQSKLAFSQDAVNTSMELKKYANMEPRRVLKDAGILDPLLSKLAKIESTKISRTRGEVPVTLINFKSLIQIGREIGRDKTLGEETSRIIKTMADLDPVYATLFRVGMSNGQGKSMFGVKDVFDELAGMRRYELPDFLKRFRFHSTQKLDPKRVVKKNGEVKFIVGKKELSGKEFFEFEQQKIDFLAKMFTDIQKHLKNNPDDAWFFTRFVTNASSNGDAIFRTSASLVGVYYKDGKLHYDIEMREEHSMPQNNIGTMFLSAAINQTPIDNVLKVAKAAFVQLSLTQVDDNMLKAIKDKDGNILRESLVDSMPNEFWEEVVPAILDNKLPWLDLGMASMIRYAKGGINLNNYFLPSKNMTIPEYFKVGIDTKGKNDAEVRALVDVQNNLISEILTGKITREQASEYINAISEVGLIANEADIKNLINVRKAREVVRNSTDGVSRGMSTFDFDETLIIGGENFVVATDPVTKQQVKITSEQWPIEGPEYAAAGYEFDFSDFANVRGGKEGPLLQKLKNQIAKYGNKNVFILTARQQASAVPIQQWLKTQGIDLPLRNITGLGKSEGEAKAQWMLQKFAEGYNDMYFVDDALPNVKAVKDVLDNLDIKSKVVQAKIKFSQDGNTEFNKMLERNTGVSRDKIFSEAQAKIRGAKTSSFKFFVPPSAEDFKGLLYNFLGRGKQGDADMAFFKEHLLDPFTRGIRDINFAKQRTSEEFKTLRKEMPDVVKNFNKKVSGTDFTTNDAIRVYLWDKNGIDVPGISEQEVSLLSDYVKEDPKVKAFADVLGNISRAKDGYVKPDENWVVGSIASDLFSQSNQVNRAEYLSEWKNNVDIIFSPENMNKIEAVYGTDFRDALENMLYRMETGSNRITGKKDKVVNSFMDWINGSVGAVMFFNTRSAMLQTLSTVNFINWGDNNIFQAAKAFANQPQYWKDFITLFNSDMLRQRRAGMQIDVNLAELTNTVAKSNMAGKSKAAIRYLLQIGFTPTQIADSFAIASGGATYYRNKIKKYLKEGLSQKEAETKAFEDFQEIAEETQQSSRPDLISQQQAGTLGRLVLAWQNTPMQYTRLTKKAISDLVNKRGDWRANVSRILYYGAMQNVIFGSLQTGLAFLLFGGDEDEEKTRTKTTRVANGALDTLLRGTGVYGAMASTLKNTIMKYMDERDKPYGRRELSKVALEAVQLSPPIGSKLRKIMSAIYSYEYNKGVPEKMGISIDNPILNVVGNIIEATTNAPLARVVRKAQNIEEAINGNHEMWKRVALIAGWDKWSLDVKDEELEKAKAEVKQEKKEKKAEEKKAKKEEAKKKVEEEKKASGIKSVRCSGTKSNGERCSIMVDTKAKTAKCSYHKTYKPNEASDRDGDGKKEYQCKATTGSGNRCRNRTENTNKKCYAHQ